MGDEATNEWVQVQGPATGFAQEITIGDFTLHADEPVNINGTDTGPTPHQFLLAALGSCTSMTLGFFARRKQWALEHVSVRLRYYKDGAQEHIAREITVQGPLSDDQRTQLLAIANKCPVHKTLTSNVQIDTKLAEPLDKGFPWTSAIAYFRSKMRRSVLTKPHIRALVRLALLVPIVVPIVLWSAAFGARENGWDIVHTALVSATITMCFLAVLLVTPLLLSYPAAEKERGFVFFWFVVSTFFNVTWQVPLSLFRSAITTAEHTYENLIRFISWWGYGFADHHYGTVTPLMRTFEIWWLLAVMMVIVGFVYLRKGREGLAFTWLGVAGALQSYNASLYVLQNWVTEDFGNVLHTTLGFVLYWGFNLLWTFMSGLAAFYSFRIVLRSTAR